MPLRTVRPLALPLAACALVACLGTHAPGDARATRLRIAAGPPFRVAGLHRFDAVPSAGAGTVRWRLERLGADDADAPDSVLRRAAPSILADSAVGGRAAFTLAAPGRESVVYRIVAAAGAEADTTLVRAFPPDVRTSFVHHGPSHPPVRVFLTVPRTLGPDTRLVLVMHGASRNADGYADSWVDWAATSDYVAAAPEFTRADWRGAARYNLGNVIAAAEEEVLAGRGTLVPEREWTFSVVDDLQARLRRDFALADSAFDLWGHSAGAQFVHRFLLFKPRAPVRLAIAANAGWYTAPEPDVAFPFGARHPGLGIGPAELRRWTRRPMLFMRGTADTLRDDDFRTGAEADRQGRTRWERAAFMLDRARAFDPSTAWTLEEVPGAGHSQRQMAPAGQAVLAARRRTGSR